MKVLNNLEEIEAESIFLTMGNFDGVHKGHRFFLESLAEDAASQGAKSVVVSFSPHPRFVLNPKDNFLINTEKEKIEILKSCQIDYYLPIPFDRDLSLLTPEEFLQKFILTSDAVKKFYLGYDFAFGANKQGDHDFMKAYLQPRKIEVVVEKAFKIDERLLSSSLVRESLELGKMEDVSLYLDRHFFICGEVIRGDGRGRTIGFPTANIRFNNRRMIPGNGVYEGEILVRAGRHRCLVNVGVRPTFKEQDPRCVEAHILDFADDIYGEPVELSFLKKLRDEIKFESREALVSQIKKDVASVQ